MFFGVILVFLSTKIPIGSIIVKVIRAHPTHIYAKMKMMERGKMRWYRMRAGEVVFDRRRK
jgi:hypothetical protein